MKSTTTTKSNSTVQFASEGFDLSQATSDGQVLEIGGGTTPPAPGNTNASGSAIQDAESCKARGNEYFAQHEWKEAHEWYTKAIEATPGELTGEKLLSLQQEWDDEQARSWREQLREYEDAKQQQQAANETPTMEQPQQQKKSFEPPPHPHGDNLAVYYSNRAAAAVQREELQDAIRDCTIAVLLRPSYVKAWVRRATAYEKQDDTEKALQDIQHAMTLDKSNAQKLRQQQDRLQKAEDERLEKLKAETMDKLKDLGNSLLGNFGLSLDNFKTEQDPNTGSYSISFQNN